MRGNRSDMFRPGGAMKRFAATLVAVAMCGTAWGAVTPFNTNNPADLTSFLSGATVIDFESSSLGGLSCGLVTPPSNACSPQALASYTNTTNGTIPVGEAAQLSFFNNVAGGVFTDSGGGTPQALPLSNPGNPVALLQLGGTIPATDAHSGTNVAGPMLNRSSSTDPYALDLDSFVEIHFVGGNVNRVGMWLNPSLSNVLFIAFDQNGLSLSTINAGLAGNFVGVQSDANNIRSVSVFGGVNGFTFDDLTIGQIGGTSNGGGTVSEPSMLLLLSMGVGLLLAGTSRRTYRA